MIATNPLLREWTGLLGLPPFAEVLPEHFEPAFDVTMAQHVAEVDAIADATEAPSFENTVVAFDRAGAALYRVS